VPLSFSIHKAARILKRGGVVAYPTEGVYGLGCLPDDAEAVERILNIKQRDPARGLIIIAADRTQLEPWIATDRDLHSSASHPVTWIVPASAATPAWITGQHDGIAVRLTTHPVARALCRAAGSALVSTSANTTGRRPAINAYVLRRQFHGLVDYIVPGNCGPWSGPSEIRHMQTGTTLRQAGN